MPDDRIARRRMDRLVLGALCLSVLATLALAAYAYRVSERQIQATLWVNHTQDVLAALSGVRTALDDLGGAISDYIITGRERDRARYVDTLRRLSSEIARPRSLTSDNPAQQKRLDDLNTALQTLPSSMDVVPDASRSLGSSAAQRLIGITQKIDLAQALVGSAEEDERVLLHARGVEEQAAIARFRLSAAALLVLMVSALGLLYWTVRRQRAAERKWMQSEEFFHLMAASAADYGMFVLDPAGRVITWNPGAERINGYRADEIVGRHFSRFYPPEDVAGEKPARELATAAAAGEAHDEGWRVRKDGTRYWADVVITALRDESGELRGYAKLTRDMTERRQAEEALRNEVAARERIDAELKILNESLADRVAARTSELAASRDNLTREMAERMLAQELLQRSESRLRGIIESAMDAIITVDETERIVLFNSAAEAIFGCTRDEALGGPLAQFIPERFHAEHPAHIRRFGEGDGTSRRMGGQRIVTGLRRNGEEFPIDASISQAATAVGKFFTVILRDVTERVRAEEALRRSKEELRELAAIASSAREQERARIARELHDDLAQMLTALNMDLIWAGERLVPNQDELRCKLLAMGAIVKEGVTATRRIAADLRPLMLDDLGLVPAAQWLIQNFSARTGVACSLEVDPPELELEDPHATAIFRILQESLANIARHAQASRVVATLNAHHGEIKLTVQDNGRGFRLDDPRKPNSFGLVGLRERAYLLQGAVHVASAPGQGTTIEARVPLPAKK